MMKLTGLTLVTSLAAAAADAGTTTPSFDCAKAGSQAEKLVCSDESLAALDRRLADRYRRLSEELRAEESSRLRATQRGWIKGRDDCWKSDDLSACVRDAYHDRLIELQLQDPRLFAPTPVGYDCPEKDPRKPLMVTYFAHFDPPAAVVTYGDDQVRMVLAGEQAGQHTRDYGARGASLRQQGLGMTLDWYGSAMHCTARGSPRDEKLQGVRPDVQPLGLVRLQSSRYTGFEDVPGEIELTAGHWEGEPYQPGGASLPRVDFLGELVARGDLNGDGHDEAAVVLTTNFGGTGVFHYLAIVEQEGQENRNIATRAIGDRVQVQDLRIDEGHIILDLVRPRPQDAACCPTEVASLDFRLENGRLTEPLQQGRSTTLAPAILAGQQWRLAEWKLGEPVNGRLTLSYADGVFTGNAGCNDYSAPVSAVDSRGSIRVGEAIPTGQQCSPDAMANEQRFLGLLPRVNRFWFHAGQLALAYDEGVDFGVMFLSKED